MAIFKKLTIGGAEPAKLQEKTTTATENGTVVLIPDTNYDGLSKATVEVAVPGPDLIDIAAGEITENGEYEIETPEGYDGIGKVTATIAVPTPTYEVYAGEYEELGGLINFTIDGVTYQAENGMTWLDWCNSDYNTNGAATNGDDEYAQIIYAPSGKYLFEEEGCTSSMENSDAAVNSDEIIIANHAYYSMTGNFQGGLKHEY